MRYRGFLLFLFSLVSISSVSALEVPRIITDTLRSVFQSVPEIYMIRFAFFVAIYAIFYYVLSKFVFKDSPKTGAIIGLTISLISAILTPATLLMTVFKTYSFIFGFVLLAAPIFAVMMFIKKFGSGSFGHFMKALVFLIAAVLFSYLASSPEIISFLGDNAQVTMQTIAWVGAVAFILAAIFQLIELLGNLTGKNIGFKRPKRGARPERQNQETRALDKTVDATDKREKEDRADIEDEERDIESLEHKLYKILKKLDHDLKAYYGETDLEKKEHIKDEIKKFIDKLTKLLQKLSSITHKRDVEAHELYTLTMGDKKLEDLIRAEEESLQYFRNGFSAVVVNLQKLFSGTMTEENDKALLQQTTQYVEKLMDLADRLEITDKEIEDEVED